MENQPTHKIYELVLANATSRDDKDTREDDREIGSHESEESKKWIYGGWKIT